MDNDIFCFLCGSELELNQEKETAHCIACKVDFECYIQDGKVMGIGIGIEGENVQEHK